MKMQTTKIKFPQCHLLETSAVNVLVQFSSVFGLHTGYAADECSLCGSSRPMQFTHIASPSHLGGRDYPPPTDQEWRHSDTERPYNWLRVNYSNIPVWVPTDEPGSVYLTTALCCHWEQVSFFIKNPSKSSVLSFLWCTWLAGSSVFPPKNSMTWFRWQDPAWCIIACAQSPCPQLCSRL